MFSSLDSVFSSSLIAFVFHEEGAIPAGSGWYGAKGEGKWDIMGHLRSRIVHALVFVGQTFRQMLFRQPGEHLGCAAINIGNLESLNIDFNSLCVPDGSF